jgi:hypothetical protein
MNWEMIIALTGLGALVYGMLRNLKIDLKERLDQIDEKIEKKFEKVDDRFVQMDKKIDDKFDFLDKKIDDKFDFLDKKIDNKFDFLDKKIDNKFEVVQVALMDIRDRIAYLEATNILTMPSEPIKPNARSQAAMERWKKKRQKAVEAKEQK